ncbi:MAG: DUF4395 domain-containing protein [Actinomycetes bacterium]
MSTTTNSVSATRSGSLIDPRGPRFGAAITTVVLAVVLLTSSSWLLAVQAIVFGLGAIVGLSAQPYGVVYRRLVRPRLAPPRELEESAPPRFAQGVGLAFAVAGLAGYLGGVSTLGTIAVALALGAAFLNAAFNFCLGCEMYLLGRRLFSRQ